MTKVKYLLWLLKEIENLEADIRIYPTKSELKIRKEIFEECLENFRKISDL